MAKTTKKKTPVKRASKTIDTGGVTFADVLKEMETMRFERALVIASLKTLNAALDIITRSSQSKK